MRWKRRKRGTPKQIGKPFPILQKRKLPKIKFMQTTFPSGRPGAQPFLTEPKTYEQLRRERIARQMAKKPVTNVTYMPPNPNQIGVRQYGSIAFNYDGSFIRNYVKIIPHNKWVGSWDVNMPAVYIDRNVPEKYWKSLAIHEAV